MDDGNDNEASGGSSPGQPAFYDDEVVDLSQLTRGNFGMGVVIGGFCGCFGVAGVYIANAGSETKRGAWIGFAIAFALGLLARLALMRRY